MAEIKPFRGLRYTGAAGPAGTLTCPPADGAEAGPYSAGRLALCPAEAGPLLQQWLTDSLVKIDMDPAFYLYEQQAPANGRTQTVRGFLALVRLDGSVQPRRTEAGAAEEAGAPADGALRPVSNLRVLPRRKRPDAKTAGCAFPGYAALLAAGRRRCPPAVDHQRPGRAARQLRGFHRPHTVRRRRRDARVANATPSSTAPRRPGPKARPEALMLLIR